MKGKKPVEVYHHVNLFLRRANSNIFLKSQEAFQYDFPESTPQSQLNSARCTFIEKTILGISLPTKSSHSHRLAWLLRIIAIDNQSCGQSR